MNAKPSGSHPVPLGPGDLVAGCYRILEVLESPSLWGAVYRVADETRPGRDFVLKQMRVPPLRQGLEERVARVYANVEAWKKNPHETRAAIEAVFEEGKAIWVLMNRVPGVDIATFLKKKKLVVKAQWRADTAVNLARALAELLGFDEGRQFLMEMTARNVLITPDGEVHIVGFGLNRGFKPGTPPDCSGDAADVAALRRFGELMLALLTGEIYTPSVSIVESALPEELGYVVLRALLPSRPQYPSFKSMLKDLNLFRDVLVAENLGSLTWDEIEMVDQHIPWRKRFLPPVLFRATQSVIDLLLARPGVARATVLTLILGFALFCIVDMAWRARSRMVPRALGPALYIVEEGGVIELVSVAQKRSLGAFDAGGEVAGCLYSPRTGRAYFTVPSKQQMFVCSFEDNETRTYPFPSECLQQLYGVAGDTFALSVGTSNRVGTIDLAAPRPRKPIDLQGAPVDLVYDTAMNAVVYLQDSEHLEAYSVLTRQVLKRCRLGTPARLLRTDPGAREIWLVAEPASAPLEVYAASNLQKIGTLTLQGNRVIDAIVKQERVYLLLASGELATVLRTNLPLGEVTHLEIERKIPLGSVRPRSMLLPVPGEMWLLLDGGALLIVDLASGKTRHVMLKGPPLRGVMAIPRAWRGSTGWAPGLGQVS